MTNVLHGHKFLKPLCEALGINGPTQKIVIVCDVQDAVRVYVKRLVTVEQIDAITAAFADATSNPDVQYVADVIVNDQGELDVTHGQ